MGRNPDDTNPNLPAARDTRGSSSSPGSGVARLVQIGGARSDEVGRVLLLDRDRAVVGRAVDAALVINDASASRNHVAVERRDGAYHLVDLDSRNGVTLNYERVKTAVLRDGDRIQLGTATLLRFSTGPQDHDGLWQNLDVGRAAAWTYTLETQKLQFSDEVDPVLHTHGARLAGQQHALAAVVHPDDCARIAVALSATAQGFEQELRLRVGDDAWRWALLRGQLLRSASGRPERISGTVSDVNDRKRRDLELGRMALMFESLSDGVFLTDETNRVVDLNSSAQLMFQLDKASATQVKLFELIGAASPAQLEAVALGAIRSSGRWSTELHIASTNKDTPFEVVGFPLRNDDVVLGAAFLFRDLTERRQLQAQLAFYDRLSSLGTMSAGIAHEINNPLTFVSNNIDHVMLQLANGNVADPAEALEALQDALEGTRRIAGIVRDLKAFSRDDIAPKPVPTNVQRALEVAFKMTNKLTAPRARVVTDLPAEIPFALATESRLAQVFVNLLINAAQAIPDGRSGSAEIHVRLRVGDTQLLIEVRDTGVGMSPEVLSRVFDPFFTTKPVGVGTGLGLSICHGLVSGFGGSLTAVSEPGKGSTFTVQLARAGARPAVAAPAAAMPLKRPARVLVVDDEPLILRAMGRVLQPHEVVTRGSVDEALGELRTGTFDVVLCDLMMPGRTGMDLYDIVQREQPELLPSIVFVTGGAFTNSAREFLATVPNATVNKPIDAAELSRVIHERLQATSRSNTPTVELTGR